MRAGEILREIKKITGLCDNAAVFDIMTLAVEMLSQSGLFDPLIGYYRFNTNGENTVVLPRDLDAVVRVRIDSNPAFTKGRLFEFTPNTIEGDGDVLGYSWHDKGESPIQNEKGLPGKVKYKYTSTADSGKTIRVIGRDSAGNELDETIAASLNGTESAGTFYEINQITRQETSGQCSLFCGDATLASFYADETHPSRRRIKVSKKVASVLVIYKRTMFSVRDESDPIPVLSRAAMMLACRACQKLEDGSIEEYSTMRDKALEIAQQAQDSRDASSSTAQALESQPVIEFRASAPDSLLVGDVYEHASKTFGNVGKTTIFANIQNAIRSVMSQGAWPQTMSKCSVVASNGISFLPSFCSKPLSVRKITGRVLEPANRWFEFGVSGRQSANIHDTEWRQVGRSPLNRAIPSPGFKPCAVCDSDYDIDAKIRIYGTELSSGHEIEVWRDGVRGWAARCSKSASLASDCPTFNRITQVEKPVTSGPVRLYALPASSKRVSLFGDCGLRDEFGSPANNVERLVKSYEPDAVILLGDINYETGAASTIDENVGSHWRKFIHPYKGSKPLRAGEQDAKTNALWPVAGNHDWGNVYLNPSGLNPYLDYFTLPGNERYYSVVIGEAEFFILDGEPNEPDGNTIGSIQHAWLVQKVAASTAKFKVVCTHKPPYSSSAGAGHGNHTPMQWDYASMGIDCVFAAHFHAYERQERDGIPFVICGTGGYALHENAVTSASTKALFVEHGATFADIYSWGIQIRFVNASGETRDSFWIGNQNHGELLAEWMPDEQAPMNTVIEVDKSTPSIEVLFDSATPITSIYNPLPIASREAVVAAITRMKKLEEGDVATAEQMGAIALRAARQDAARYGIQGVGITVPREMSPAGTTGNIT